MAKIIEDAGGFKVLEVSRKELIEKIAHLGALGLCDYCMKSPSTGYYIAVLDQWLCPECYQDFLSRNVPCPEDSHYETMMFNAYCRAFNVKNPQSLGRLYKTHSKQYEKVHRYKRG